jgi:hypothetical protein
MIAWPSRRPLRHCATALVLLAAAGCGGDGQTDPSDVAEITLDATALILDAVGQTRQLTATTLDADGNTVDVAVEWTSDDPGIVTVEGDGLLVGQGPGSAEVTASVGTVSATATVSVNSVSALQVFDGNGQTAPAGQAVPTAPAVRVADAQDQPVPDVRIRFQAATGSGTITDELQETDADGVARVGSWRVGSAGVNTLTASIEGADALNEPIEFLATTGRSAASTSPFATWGSIPATSCSRSPRRSFVGRASSPAICRTSTITSPPAPAATTPPSTAPLMTSRSLSRSNRLTAPATCWDRRVLASSGSRMNRGRWSPAM